MVQFFANTIQQPDLGRAMLMADRIKHHRFLRDKYADEQARTEQVNQLGANFLTAPEGEQESAYAALASAAPDVAMKLQEHVAKMDDRERETAAQESKMTARLAQIVLNAPEEQRPMAYQKALDFARRKGMDVSNAPPEYSGPETDQWLKTRAGLAMTMEELLEQGAGPEAPSGYRYTDDGTLSFIPGGPEDPSVIEGKRAPLPIQRKLELAGIDPQSEEGQSYIRADLAGQQVSVETSPDGTTKLRIGKGAGNEMGTREAGEVGIARFNARNALARLEGIKDKYDPEALTFEAAADRFWNNLRDKSLTLQSIFGDLTPEEEANLSTEAKFMRRTYDHLNQTLKEMSGAAITPQEAERQEESLPAPSDGPTTFKAKLDDAIEWQRNALMRYNYLLNQTGEFNANNPGLSIEEMPKVVNQAGERIEAEIRARHPEWEDAEVADAVDRRLKELFFNTPEGQ